VELVFFNTSTGRSPVIDAIRELDAPSRAKVGAFLRTLEEQGRKLREPHVKSLGNGLMELRVPIGHGQYRVFYFFAGAEVIVLLHAFQKKSQKAPLKELELAHKRLNEWKRRTL
jgi:putative addiction module killer protein